MKWLLLIGTTVLALTLAGWQYLAPDRSREGDAFAGPTKKTAPSPPPLEMQGIGYIEPVSEIRRLMMRSGGVIKHCYVQVGEKVRKGEPIMELENSTQRADVELARKNLELTRTDADYIKAGINPFRIRAAEQTVERLREKLRHDQLEAQRYRSMVRSRAASPQEYEAMFTQRRQTSVELREQEAQLEYLKKSVTPQQKAMLEAKVRHAHANLDLAEEKLREMTLLAPFDGTVLKLLKREGEGVRTTEPEAVALFGDMSRVRVRAEMDERFVRHLQAGQAATVFGRNLAGQTYRGRVAYLERLMGNKTVFSRASSERKDLDVLQVLIDLGPDFQAPAGLQVDVKIETPARPD